MDKLEGEVLAQRKRAERERLLEEAVERLRSVMRGGAVQPLQGDDERWIISAAMQGKSVLLRMSDAGAKAVLAHPDLSAEGVARIARREDMAKSRDVLLSILSHPHATWGAKAVAVRNHMRYSSYTTLLLLKEGRLGERGRLLYHLAELWGEGSAQELMDLAEKAFRAPVMVQELLEVLLEDYVENQGPSWSRGKEITARRAAVRKHLDAALRV